MNSREKGARYEEAAAVYLQNQGYQILERNFRCRQGEIDLIARDREYLVFVEVKYRRTSRQGEPAEAVGPKKQLRIRKTAAYYLYLHRIPESVLCRFDVVAVGGDRIRLIQNAF